MEHLIGKTHRESWTVTHELLASSMKSGAVDVFATPYMIALMEYTCMQMVQPALPEGITTVGSAVNITHVHPTLEGMTAYVDAELLETDGRRFLFRVTAYDEAGMIGQGTHERCTVKADRFLEKAAARRDAGPQSAC